jgi:hypothetical protein
MNIIVKSKEFFIFILLLQAFRLHQEELPKLQMVEAFSGVKP